MEHGHARAKPSTVALYLKSIKYPCRIIRIIKYLIQRNEQDLVATNGSSIPSFSINIRHKTYGTARATAPVLLDPSLAVTLPGIIALTCSNTPIITSPRAC